jgi:hypothetical protein
MTEESIGKDVIWLGGIPRQKCLTVCFTSQENVN